MQIVADSPWDARAHVRDHEAGGAKPNTTCSRCGVQIKARFANAEEAAALARPPCDTDVGSFARIRFDCGPLTLPEWALLEHCDPPGRGDAASRILPARVTGVLPREPGQLKVT